MFGTTDEGGASDGSAGCQRPVGAVSPSGTSAGPRPNDGVLESQSPRRRGDGRLPGYPARLSTSPSETVSKNLTVANDGTAVVLQGSFVSNADTDVTGFVSSIEYDDYTLAFTHTEITGIAIADTQTVSITVTLSFS